MGMFSWKCKGCGEELIAGEQVIIEGHRGTYDGYGRCGDNYKLPLGIPDEDVKFDYHKFLDSKPNGWDKMPNPVAWHAKCHDKATEKQKKNKRPSRRAPNQGFGRPNPAFM